MAAQSCRLVVRCCCTVDDDDGDANGNFVRHRSFVVYECVCVGVCGLLRGCKCVDKMSAYL